MSDQPAQPALIPMTDEDQKRAGATLARLIHERTEMLEEHAETRKEQKAELDGLERRIRSIADTLRTQAGR